jgi:hypothetical protein
MEGNRLVHTEKRVQMELFINSLIMLIVFIAFGLAALRWGFDSRDGIDGHKKML